MPWHHYDWGWHMAWMWIGGLLLLVALILLVRWLAASPGAAPQRDPAEEALRLRYARGEIAPEEFESRLNDLRRRR